MPLAARHLAPSLLTALLLLCPGPAHALDVRQQYEEDLLRWGLARSGLSPDPAPEGKVIEKVVIEREEIIARSDPWPGFLNIFHARTRDSVIRQELLVRPGQRWDPNLVRESERNLRKLFILAVVRSQACRSALPGKVVLLVVTKDLWSIRLNSEFSMVGTVLQLYDFFPTEQNFLGRNKRVSLHVRLRQLDLASFSLRDGFALGNIYIDDRLLGSRVRLSQRFDALLSGDVPCGGYLADGSDAWCPGRSLGDLEGIYGYIWLERPLYALSTEWGFSLYALVDTSQVRYYVQPGPVLRTVSLEGLLGYGAGTGGLPRIYDRSLYETYAVVTRSFGLDHKQDVSGGLSAYLRRYAVPEGLPFSREVQQAYADRYLPRSEDAAYLFARYRSYGPRYIKLRNIRSLGLTEDITLGHDVTVELRGAVELSSFEPFFLEGLVDAAYRLHRAGDLFTVRLAGRSRWQPSLEQEAAYDDPWANARLEAELENASPPVAWGRVFFRVRAVLSHNDLTRATQFLGGDAGLRGYASRQFEGDDLFQVNLEYRSRPINLLTLHLGLVLFYDGGAAFGGPDPSTQGQELAFKYHQSMGLGLRALFPQFDREPLRLDIGFPLQETDRGDPGTWFSLSFKQVF